MIIEADKVEITGADNLTIYNDPESLSGRIVKRFFCKTCGKYVCQSLSPRLETALTWLCSPIKSETEPATQAGKVILKLGIFEHPPQAEFETFVDKKIPWVGRHEGTTGFKIAMGGDKAD